MPELESYQLDQAQQLVREAIQRMQPRHKRWRQLETLYRTGDAESANLAPAKPGTLGDLWPDLDSETVNMVLPHINVVMSSVVRHDPQLVATPYGGGEIAEASAEAAQAVVSYFWTRTQATSDLQDATWDMIVSGNGFLKVGWNYLEDERDKSVDELEAELADMLEADAGLAELENVDELSELDEPGYTPPEELAEQLEPTQTIVEVDEPYVSYVSPYDVFVPANARRMWETRWVAHRVTLPIDEVKANDTFDRGGREDLQPDGTTSGNDEYVAEWRRQQEDAKGPMGNHEVFETATIFEFYDMRTRSLLVFQLDTDRALYEGDLPYSHRYPPFVHLRNYSESGTEFWAFGDLENVASIQRNFNETIREQLDNFRRSGNKYLVRDDLWTDELIEVLESDIPDAVGKVELPTGERLQDVVHHIERAALSGDVYATSEIMEDMLRKVLGINDFQAGGMGADRMSATAAAVVDGIASLRAQEKVAQVEDGAAQVGNLLLLLCQEFLDQPTPIRVAGPEGAYWPEVSTQDIRGEFMVEIEGGSMNAVNPATREQRGMRLMTEILPIIAELGFDPVPVVRSALRDMGFSPDLLLVRPEEAPGPAAGQSGQPPPGGPAQAGPTPSGNGQGPPAAAATESGGPPTAEQAQTLGDIAI